MTHTPWKVTARVQKQSNYGIYKAALHRGEGRAAEFATITAPTPELALEMAHSVANAQELLRALEASLTRLSATIDADVISMIKKAIAKAKGE